MSDATEYGPEAYAPDGTTLWWELVVAPGTKKRKYGAERKIAAWLAANVEVGETFTMRDLRLALGEGVVPNDAEHLNRRLRSLRPEGWDIPTTKDDAALAIGEYRVDAVGWHPGLGARPATTTISDGMRRRVFDRDMSLCAHCGVAAQEPYPNEPNSRAIMTVGHRVANAHGGSSKDINNLQTECKRCNEPVRQEQRPAESLEELLPSVTKIGVKDAQKLLSWLDVGHRTRDAVDQLHDRIRQLSPDDRERVARALRRKVSGS